MSIVCPTVTAKTTDEYTEQLKAVVSFAPRIHLDLGDGIFTTRLVASLDKQIAAVTTVDVHLMHHHPENVIDELIALQPHTVIFHAEADGDIAGCIRKAKESGIKAGIALLQETTVQSVSEHVKTCDHALIFSGSLGSFGGTVDLSLLKKVQDIREIRPDIEIGWDGGINAQNIKQLVAGGVDVLNVGGAIQRATHPENAYRDLTRQL